MELDEAFWRENCGKSGQQIARENGMDPGNVRKAIRRAKGKYPDLEWYADPRHKDYPKDDKLAKFLSRGRTKAEIEDAGYTLEEARKLSGYDLFETRNHLQQKTYLLLPPIQEELKVAPRIWSHRWAVDTDGSPQPYLMIQMPDKRWDKIKVVPLADVHYGAEASMVEKLREYVNWIASEPNIFCFLNGDMLENSHGDSCRGVSIYEQDVRPRTQVEELAHILAPIAHKILWAHPGNHEDRSRIRDFDPLERLCELLGIPYSYEPIYVDVLWRGTPFSFHAKHGNTGSQTKGGKMNAAARPQQFQDHTMFTVMSHVHDGDVSRNTRICRDRVNFRLDFRKQFVIITPSFFRYFGSYASKHGLSPGSYGAINCDLYRNGDFHTNA